MSVKKSQQRNDKQEHPLSKNNNLSPITNSPDFHQNGEIIVNENGLNGKPPQECEKHLLEPNAENMSSLHMNGKN